MANEEQTSKDTQELIDRAWSIAQKTRNATLVTVEGTKPIARPMSAHVDELTHTISFLTAADSRKTRNDGDQVVVFFINGNSYVSVTGGLSVSNDRARIRELWTPFVKAWWDSPEDPDIRVLDVAPSEIEIWDGPNKLFAGALMLTAAVTGAKPKVGDHAKASAVNPTHNTAE